jgi:hypothetical protein
MGHIPQLSTITTITFYENIRGFEFGLLVLYEMH